MNTELQTFEFQSHQLTVITDEYGKPWFIAKEVAEILEYSDTFEMTKKLDDDEKSNLQNAGFENREIGGLGTPTGGRGIIIINESGLWSSVLRSTKPEAKIFKKWLTSEVLPAIHKTGSYIAPNTETAEQLAHAQELIATQRQLIAAQQDQIEHTKKTAVSYVGHLQKELDLKSLSVNALIDQKTVHREELSRAIRAQRPITGNEEQEIKALFDKRWPVRTLSLHFYRSPAIIKRAIRNQGGAV